MLPHFFWRLAIQKDEREEKVNENINSDISLKVILKLSTSVLINTTTISLLLLIRL